MSRPRGRPQGTDVGQEASTAPGDGANRSAARRRAGRPSTDRERLAALHRIEALLERVAYQTYTGALEFDEYLEKVIGRGDRNGG